MKVVNPDFRIDESLLDEALPDDANTDVQMLQNLKTPAQKTAYSRIDNQKEFNDAFEYWFNKLGVSDDYKNKINITSSLAHIRDVMEKRGIHN